jgi:hypothetical protein
MFDYTETMFVEQCNYCSHIPNAHSFSFVSNTDNDSEEYQDIDYNVYNDPLLLNENSIDHLYKTKIADAKLYDNPISIIYHIKLELRRNKTHKMDYWNWYIDFEGAGIKHYMAFGTVRELSRWINSEKDGFCKNLKNIKIINSGIMIKPLVSLSKWFLPEHINVVCV